ncbi:astacin [Trichonephila clavipes]|nr:astacin [Trichonephila clavipes]
MLWKVLLSFLAFLKPELHDSPVNPIYPAAVLEPWGLKEWNPGKPSPWGPVTEQEKLVAERALHNNKFGGDMKIKGKRMLGNSVSNKSWYWPTKNIPYVIDRSIQSQYHEKIAIAINQINKTTCLKFVPRKNEKDYIKFDNSTTDHGCWSWVGYQTGVQEVNIDEGCQYVGSIVHEMLHAIGFWHEHQRHDRNKYVTIYDKNVTNGLLHNFDITQAKDEIIYNKFDYNSIMIYGNYAFSKRLWQLKTVEATDKRELTEPWSKPGLDGSDVDRINCMYCKKCKPIKV